MAAAFALLVTALSARAELSIEITHGADNPTRIAVVPMTLPGGQLPGDISAIVSADLDRSGLFRTMARENMLAFPRSTAEIRYHDWSVAGIQYVVVADVQRPAAGRIKVTFSLAQVAG